jgi:hypothetical protein
MRRGAPRPRPWAVVPRVALACALGAIGCSLGSNGGGPESPGGSGTGSPGSTGTGSGEAGAIGVITGAGGEMGAAGSSISTGAGGTGIVGTTPVGTGTGGQSGPADASASDAGASDAGASDAGGGCNVFLLPLIPGSFSGLQAGPLSLLRVRAQVSGHAGVPAWIWLVRLAGGQSLADINFTPVDSAGDTIDIKLEAPGRYEIEARIDGAPECDRSPVLVTVDPPQTPSFLFRVTPPAGSRLPMRDSTLAASDVAGASHTIDLGAGGAAVVSLLPTDPRGFPLPSYVVLTSGASALDVQAYTSTGPLVASLVPNQLYDVLVVPDGGWAPLLVTGLPDVIGQSQSLAITAGASIAGTARDGNGKAVANARVILRDGLLPSTVGVTDGAGAFGVSVRAGTFAAVITPPASAGLYEAHVASSPGIPVGVSALSLDMTWAAVASATLTMTVRAADGSPAVGAAVRVESSAEVASVGTLGVHAGASDVVELAATGTARADALTNGSGVASLGPLPAGPYHVVVAPAAGSSAAITELDVTLPSTGLARDVALASTVTQPGTLEPAAHAAGAMITAIDEGALPPVTLASAIANAAGAYALTLSPARTYELLVTPVPGSGLASSVLAVFSPGATPAVRSDTIPGGLSWRGSVTGGGRPVTGAVVQVFCVGPSASCLDPTIAVAQGTTAPDGTLTLVLPNPS